MANITKKELLKNFKEASTADLVNWLAEMMKIAEKGKYDCISDEVSDWNDDILIFINNGNEIIINNESFLICRDDYNNEFIYSITFDDDEKIIDDMYYINK